MIEYKVSVPSLLHNIQSLGYLRSELLLVGILLLIVLLDLCIKDQKKSFVINSLIVVAACVFSMYLSVIEFLNPLYGPIGLFFTKIDLYYNGELESISEALMTLTKQGSFFKFLMALSALFLMLFKQLEFNKNSEKELKTEYLVAVISILLGSYLMVSATHFLSLLLALEISSFGAYALVYFNADKKSKEASLKYVLYGLMATGLMLFGMSLIYIELGSLSYNALISSVMVQDQLGPFMTMGLSLLCFGLFFKLAVVPMYFWVPDVFEGASMSTIAFLSIVPKLGALGNLILMFSYVYSTHISAFSIQELLLVLGVVTTTIGNFFALGQHNIKRLFAYSSIAHSGFLLMALAVFGHSGMNSLLFYALVYVFMNFVSFMCAAFYSKLSGSDDIRKWSGLGASTVLMGVIFFIGLVALIGFPPTAGFSAKFYVFTSLIELYGYNSSKLILIVLLLGAFNILLSLFYYLKIPFHLFFQKREDLIEDTTSLLPKLQVLIVALPLVAIFLFSGQVVELIKQINDIVKYFVQ